MKHKSVPCEDWSLSWGLGTNHVGKLYLNEDSTYTWKGHQQGRHGQRWNTGSIVNFSISDKEEITIISAKGSLPTHSEVLKSIEILKTLDHG